MNVLTEKQRRFVDEYLIDPNATQAAIRAGYSKATAYSQGQRLLKNVEVAAALSAARQKRSERVEVTQDTVIGRLMKAADKAIEHETFNPAGAARCLELVGKHLGMWSGKEAPSAPDVPQCEDKVVDLAKVAGKYRPERAS